LIKQPKDISELFITKENRIRKILSIDDKRLKAVMKGIKVGAKKGGAKVNIRSIAAKLK